MVHNSLQKLTTYHEYGFILETNTDIPIPGSVGGGVLRCNIFRPLDTEQGTKYPVLMTLSPYGKDVPYSVFHPASFADVPKDQQSEFSVWETPEPIYWCKQGYIVVRVDERGIGQSPGVLNVMSAQMSSDFKESIEWAAKQSWSTGKIGLLGISYYAISQWAVAALRPEGLACIIPWEGMNDIYRDCARQDGILSNNFLHSWYLRQISSNQYGLPGKAARNWGPDTIEASLSSEELKKNEVHMPTEALNNKFLDDPYFAGAIIDLSKIEVPLLSVANWGGITLHLRGNVRGYVQATSRMKWLYFITGRHDVPFYLPESVALQKSFLDAFLRGIDDRNWLKGPNAPNGVPAINLTLRKGDPGFNTFEAEKMFPRRTEVEWPIARTQYTKYYLGADELIKPQQRAEKRKFEYKGLVGEPLHFWTEAFTEETEITGHIVANLVFSIDMDDDFKVPKDMDIFLTIRHFNPEGKEIIYTGTTGNPSPVVKGWLRASLRARDGTNPLDKHYQPYRPFSRKTVEYPHEGRPFEALVEFWPTNVVVSPGNKLVLEICSQDTPGVGIFGSNHPEDRTPEIFAGKNTLFVGGPNNSWIQFPIIPN